MSRSGYVDDCDDDLAVGRFMGVLASATRGKRGQKFFKDLLAALDTMPEKALIADLIEAPEEIGGGVCALGALGKARGIDMSKLDPEDPEGVGIAFDIAEALAREVVCVNDEDGPWGKSETCEERWKRVRRWVEKQIKTEEPR